MADWNQLLSAIEYRQREPERQAANEMRMLQLQAIKDKVAKDRSFRTYASGLNAPVAPERTESIPDEAVNASLADASSGLSKYGIQLDPSLQGQATQTKTIPAQYLSEPEKMIKMRNWLAMQGDFDKVKELDGIIKSEQQRMGFHQVFFQEFQKSGMNNEKTKAALIARYGDGAKEQLDNLDFTPSGVVQKKEGIMTDWETGTRHNIPNQSESKLVQGALTDKGYSVGYNSSTNQWTANVGGQNEPYNEAKHGKIRQAKQSVVVAGMPPATQSEFENDKRMIMNGQLMLDDVIKGAGRGGQGQAYSRKLRKAIGQENPSFNFNLQKMLVRGDATEISQAQGMRGKILSFEQAAVQNAKQLYQLSDKIDPAQIPVLNKAILAGKTQITGDPVASAYLLAWRTFVNEYARVSTTASGGGITTDTARREMEEAIRNASTKDQMQAMLRQAVMEMRHREYGYDVQLKQVYDRWGGRAGFNPELPTAEDIYKIFASETPYAVDKQKKGNASSNSKVKKPWKQVNGVWKQE
jgi:hypothetical protein